MRNGEDGNTSKKVTRKFGYKEPVDHLNKSSVLGQRLKKKMKIGK